MLPTFSISASENSLVFSSAIEPRSIIVPTTNNLETTGSMYFDTNNNILLTYNGNSWISTPGPQPILNILLLLIFSGKQNLSRFLRPRSAFI